MERSGREFFSVGKHSKGVGCGVVDIEVASDKVGVIEPLEDNFW